MSYIRQVYEDSTKQQELHDALYRHFRSNYFQSTNSRETKEKLNRVIDYINNGNIEDSLELGISELKSVTGSRLKELGKTPVEFFKVLYPGAALTEKRYGVPAAVTLAQAAFESGWGRFAIGDYNLFGIKGKGPAGTMLVPTLEEVKGVKIQTTAYFALYNNMAEALEQHAKVFLSPYPEYVRALAAYKLNKDPYEFISIAAKRYATDSSYVKGITRIMRQYKLEGYSILVQG